MRKRSQMTHILHNYLSLFSWSSTKKKRISNYFNVKNRAYNSPNKWTKNDNEEQIAERQKPNA